MGFTRCYKTEVFYIYICSFSTIFYAISISQTCLRSRKYISKQHFDKISQSTAEIKVKLYLWFRKTDGRLIFKCSLSHAKKLFYRSANAIFGEIERIASEEVVLHLIISKCIPIILYGLEACPLTKSDLQSI